VVFALDFLKGFVPTMLLVKFWSPGESMGGRLAMVSMLGVLLGHSFSMFHNFRGGKGVASTMGGLLSIMPSSLAIGLLVWLVIFHATRIVSMASLCFAASVLLTSYLFYSTEHVIFAVAINGLIFWKHRGNISRLAKGTEHKFM
jgi:glycerol-3-phosphate acyltransferase PlsY